MHGAANGFKLIKYPYPAILGDTDEQRKHSFGQVPESAGDILSEKGDSRHSKH